MLLSICIPHYNHPDHLAEVIDSVCEAKSTDFELVIVDNASTEEIPKLEYSRDPRVKIFRRPYKVSGPENLGTCMNYASGKYRIIVIDKDYIEGKYIDGFIRTLKEHPDVYGGRCILNIEDNFSRISVESSITQKLNRFFYTEDHPTGYFFREDVIEEENNLMIDFNERYNPFNVDMILARCASKGDMLLYESPIVYSLLSRPRQCNAKSNTYNNSTGNLFFEPLSRNHQMLLNIQHLKTLDIKKKDYNKILRIIYKNTIKQVTFVYRGIMSSQFLSDHYGFKTKKVGVGEMGRNLLNTSKVFLDCQNIKSSKFKRSIIITYTIVSSFAYKIGSTMLRIFGINKRSVSTTDVCVGRWQFIVD